MNCLLAFVAGIMLGAAQITTRYLLSVNNRNSILIILPIVFIYFLAAFIWIYLLKFSSNLPILYGMLILGSFISILMGSKLVNSNNIIIETKQFLAIILIATGCYLLK